MTESLAETLLSKIKGAGKAKGASCRCEIPGVDALSMLP